MLPKGGRRYPYGTGCVLQLDRYPERLDGSSHWVVESDDHRALEDLGVGEHLLEVADGAAGNAGGFQYLGPFRCGLGLQPFRRESV